MINDIVSFFSKFLAIIIVVGKYDAKDPVWTFEDMNDEDVRVVDVLERPDYRFLRTRNRDQIKRHKLQRKQN